MRQIFKWRLPRTEIELGKRTAIMGILNVTPDSFSDGGLYRDLQAALNRALQMEEQGADVLDIGGESTRPGSEAVAEEMELKRVLPVIEALAVRLKIPISIDTYRSEVAQKALAAGAQIVNDISAFRFDSRMPEEVRAARAAVVLMHSRGSREELHKQLPMKNPLREVQDELMAAARVATEAGIAREAVVMDPGVGFGKTAEESVTVLRNLQTFSRLEYPVLIGTSRKSFLGRIGASGAMPDAKNRLWETAATVAGGVLRGAHIVRVHDVAEMRTLVDTLDALF